MTNVTGPTVRFSVDETITRLRDSLATIEWASSMIPVRWTHDAPPTAAPGAWSVAMNLAHLVTYEEQLALPVLRAMAHGSDGEGTVRSGLEHWFHADAVALSSDPVDLLVSRLRAAREEQIRTIEPLTADAFNTPRTRLFTDPGADLRHSIAWVATKTFQHTWEHGNAILRVALFAPR